MRETSSPATCRSNSTSTVAILFADPVVTELFAELLNACGASPRIISDVSAIPPDARVITEPLFYRSLPRSYRHNCLLVGDTCNTGHIKSLCLSQPLTEDKVERALKSLLC